MVSAKQDFQSDAAGLPLLALKDVPYGADDVRRLRSEAEPQAATLNEPYSIGGSSSDHVP